MFGWPRREPISASRRKRASTVASVRAEQQHLDHHPLARQPQVLRLPHRAHPALAEQPRDLVGLRDDDARSQARGRTAGASGRAPLRHRPGAPVGAPAAPPSHPGPGRAGGSACGAPIIVGLVATARVRSRPFMKAGGGRPRWGFSPVRAAPSSLSRGRAVERERRPPCRLPGLTLALGSTLGKSDAAYEDALMSRNWEPRDWRDDAALLGARRSSNICASPTTRRGRFRGANGRDRFAALRRPLPARAPLVRGAERAKWNVRKLSFKISNLLMRALRL